MMMFDGFRSRWTIPLLVRRLERIRHLPRNRYGLGAPAAGPL